MDIVDAFCVEPPAARAVETGWFLFGAVVPGQTLTRVPVTSESFVIGRRLGLDLTLASPLVSGRHAELLAVGENLFVRDLDSRNGTFVNRVRVEGAAPVGVGDHIELADMEFRVEYHPSLVARPAALASYNETVAEISTIEGGWVLSQLDALISNRAVVPHFQAIVAAAQGEIIGYEALARSAVSGFEKPGCMFGKAQLLSREVELSLLCRARAVSFGKHLPEGSRIFLNTHPAESLQVDVLPSLHSLLVRVPNHQLVVEIHEGAIDDLTSIRRFIAELREMGIGIAYDDFGAGRSRLVELIQAPPDFLKFDISLIRKIHEAPDQQQRMLRTLVDMVHDMGTAALAEGLERRPEADCCRELGFDYLQGFLYGRPQPATRPTR
ncbi:MAG: EAL domain-containing protein [Planctomycetaceae bacterium]